MITTDMKGRLEEGGEARSAGGPGLGTAAAAESVAEDRVTEEGT